MIEHRISQFKEKFDPLFSAFLREKIDEAKSHIRDPAVSGALEQAYEIFGRRGKRMRPFVLYSMYKAAGGSNDKEALEAGMSVELQHAFALIQDDIIDRGSIRHGVPTAHEVIKRELTNRGVTADIDHMANAQAMLIGDLLSSWSYGVLNDMDSPYEQRILEQLQEMVAKVIIGEMMDVSMPLRNNVSHDEISERDAFKTAAYTFVYPLLMGVTLAGKEADYEIFCKEFGACMGEVYQIQDDILDIVGESGTPQHSDINEHQHTYLTQYVLEHGDHDAIQALETFFSGKAPDPENEEKVLGIVSRPEVIGAAQAAAKELLEEAKTMIMAANFSKQDEKLWLDVVGFFENRFDS